MGVRIYIAFEGRVCDLSDDEVVARLTSPMFYHQYSFLKRQN